MQRYEPECGTISNVEGRDGMRVIAQATEDGVRSDEPRTENGSEGVQHTANMFISK